MFNANEDDGQPGKGALHPSKAEKRGPLRVSRSGFPYFGQSVGIIMLDTARTAAGTSAVTGNAMDFNQFTRVPGDVGNATSFDFPVQYHLLGNLDINDVISKAPSERGVRAMIEAAKELERQGVRAIATTCGFFSYFQDLLTAEVEVPVFTSALLQVPLASRLIGKNRKVGIITANGSVLTPEHLSPVGIDDDVPHVIWGIENRPQEESFWVWDELDPERRTKRIETALALTATRLQEAHPDIGAIVLECTNTPPGSFAVQQATGLPVFDVITMIKWAHLATTQRRYTGYM